MSVQSEITRISGNVSDALDAVAAKGVTVPSGATSDNLASLIGAIATATSPYYLVLGQADGIVADGGDLNTYIYPGVYQIDSSYTIANKPSGTGAGLLRVWIANASGNTPGQKWYFVVQSFIDLNGHEWRRGGGSGNAATTTLTWNAWWAACAESATGVSF